VLVFQEDGSPVYFKVNDPVFFQALSGINSPSFDNFMVKIMRQSKRWLTYGATFGPGFRIANLLRDTMHTALMEQSFIPFYDSAIGFWKSLREDEDYIKFMASGAGFGSSYVEADNPKIAAKFINRVLESEGKEAGERILDTPKKMLDFWQKIGSASENAARVRLYQKLTKEGYSHMDAAFRARDLLDFTMSGQSRTVQFLIQTVPFLNARVQGLYKLGRANPFTNKENRKNFLLWGGMLVAASMALWFWNRDRDEYEELEDWDKWTYYHFWIGDKHYRIPKPFEVGAIFSSFPETILDAMNGNNEAKHIADFIAHTATETFALGLPQIFTPALEQWANQSFFTGRPIVGERLENLEPGEQKEPWTSETMQVIGRVFNVSPKRAEALINGYFSTFGMFLLTGSDILLHHLMDFPADPTKRIEDYPGIGRFVREKGPARYTRYQTWFYDTVNEMDRTMQTIRQYIQTGEVDKGQKKALNNKEMLKLRSEFHKVRTVLGEINQEMRRVLYDKEMSGKEKREKIDQLYEQKNKLTKQMYEVYAGKIKK
jgi:regulator of replication initiation timing